MVFGILRGLAIASVFIFGVAIVSPESYLIKKSHLGGLAVPLIDKAVSLMPESARRHVEDNWKTAKDYLLENLKAWKKERREEIKEEVKRAA